jgi:hypothetical protein
MAYRRALFVKALLRAYGVSTDWLIVYEATSMPPEDRALNWVEENRKGRWIGGAKWEI